MRKGMGYWGPALVVIGLVGAAISWAGIRGDALAWWMSAWGVMVLVGIVLTAAARQDA